jgi:hypothetical protein
MFPTRCPDCSAAVFYFDCSCGSKVFFDFPGDPWPVHSEKCFPYLVRKLRDVEGLPYSAIWDRIEERSESLSRPIPKDLWKSLRALQNRELGGQTILEIHPFNGELVVEATIVDANLKVNILRRYKLPDNQISRGLFAELLKEPLVELVVHGNRDRETGFVSKFSFLFPLRRYQSTGLRTGIRVGCILSALNLPNGKSVWIGKDVREL